MKLENIKWPHEFSTAPSMEKNMPMPAGQFPKSWSFSVYPVISICYLCIFQSVSVLKPRGTPERYCSCFFMVFFQHWCDPKIRPPASDGAMVPWCLLYRQVQVHHHIHVLCINAPRHEVLMMEVNACGENEDCLEDFMVRYSLKALNIYKQHVENAILFLGTSSRNGGFWTFM